LSRLRKSKDDPTSPPTRTLEDDGETPLHDAALNGRKATVKLLIAKGADVNATNDSGDTSLQVAIDNKHDAVAEVLRKAGAKE